MTDLIVHGLDLTGKRINVEMKVSDTSWKPTVNIVFTRMIGIASKEEMMQEIEFMNNDLMALENELKYGHLFDALPKETEGEGAF